MKRFKFSLQPLAVLRAHRELRAKEDFAAAIHAQARTEAQRDGVRTRVAQLETTLAQGRQGRFNAAAEMQSLTAYRAECAVETQAEQAVLTAVTQTQKSRDGYIEAHRQLEAVKRLEAKARVLHRHAMNLHEQAEFDDFSSRRATRPNSFGV